MPALNQRVIEARENVGLSQAEFARKIKISRSALSQIESGATKAIKLETATRMEKVTGFNAEWLGNGNGEKLISERAASPGLSEQEQELISQFRGLLPEQRDAFANDIANSAHRNLRARVGMRVSETSHSGTLC